MMTTKTTPLSENTHKFLKKVQLILYDKFGVEMHIPDILSYIIHDIDEEKAAKKIAERKTAEK